MASQLFRLLHDASRNIDYFHTVPFRAPHDALKVCSSVFKTASNAKKLAAQISLIFGTCSSIPE